MGRWANNDLVHAVFACFDGTNAPTGRTAVRVEKLAPRWKKLTGVGMKYNTPTGEILDNVTG